jgi:hypothetical protein
MLVPFPLAVMEKVPVLLVGVGASRWTCGACRPARKQGTPTLEGSASRDT